MNGKVIQRTKKPKISKDIVKVGILDSVNYAHPRIKKGAKQPKNITILQIGINHEYGVGNLPQRSFLRATLHKFNNNMSSFIQKEYKDVLMGVKSEQVALGRIGIKFRDYVLLAFKTGGFGRWADITQQTKIRKGSDEILFDTGQISQSIHWVTASSGSNNV